MTVETTPEPAPDCPECGTQGILSALVPTADGESATVVLCEACDIDDPDGGPLVAYFAVHGAIGVDTFEQGTALLANWLATAQERNS